MPEVGAGVPHVVVVDVGVDSVTVGAGVSPAVDGTRVAPVVGAGAVPLAGVTPPSVGMNGTEVPPPKPARE